MNRANQAEQKASEANQKAERADQGLDSLRSVVLNIDDYELQTSCTVPFPSISAG